MIISIRRPHIPSRTGSEMLITSMPSFSAFPCRRCFHPDSWQIWKIPDQDTVKGLLSRAQQWQSCAGIPAGCRVFFPLRPSDSGAKIYSFGITIRLLLAYWTMDSSWGLRAQVHLAVSADPDIGGADLKGSSACHYIISSYRLYGFWV